MHHFLKRLQLSLYKVILVPVGRHAKINFKNVTSVTAHLQEWTRSVKKLTQIRGGMFKKNFLWLILGLIPGFHFWNFKNEGGIL